ncbi:MAG: hypothetical protein P8R54_15985 [Myxococcota bacterium]|nr:hypothetical protein [Myxococcota bacterium]
MIWFTALACVNSEETPAEVDSAMPDPSPPTWHADVAPIITTSCGSCHTEGGIGGMALTTLAEVTAWSQAIYAAVESGSMPPWLASDGCNTYEQDFSLSEAEVQAVLDWIDADMPEGDPAEAVAAEPWQAPSLERVDLSLQMPAPYTPVGEPDDYRCFVMEWPYEEDAWVTGYAITPGNLAVVHHAIPFLIPPEDAATYRALDAEDPADGYSCYGSPGGGVTALTSSRWLGAWAPGSGAAVTPEGTGIQVKTGSLVVLQMHYYIDASPGSDQSSLDLQIETEPQGWADVQPWTNPAWLAGAGMEIPANSTGVTHTFQYTAEASFAIESALLHQHTLGTSGRLSVIHEDGSESCLLDIPRWDFNWQRAYQLVEPQIIAPGDVITLECTWDNPTDQDIAWGDGTGDEMCLGVTMLSEAP